MSDTKFTPGPWKCDRLGGVVGTERVDIKGVRVPPMVAICEGMFFDTRERCRANARLIAASPDMLVTLKRLTDWFDNYAPGVAVHGVEIGRIYSAARKIITDVEGR